MSQQIVRLKDFDGDFWAQNPMLALMSPFAEFKKKKNSSNIMKAIYMVYDSKSPFKATWADENEAVKDINKNYLKDENFPWEEYQSVVNAYKDKCRSSLQKMLDDLLYEIKEMELARKNLSFDDPMESEQRLKMYTVAKKLYEEAIELQSKLNEEVGEQIIHGDYVPSLIEEFALNN